LKEETWPCSTEYLSVRISRVQVFNYKSLRDVTFLPGGLSLVIGANGAGKSNLADSFDFIGEIFRDGLDIAIARKGGFENIAHRKKRRTKTPLGFEIEIHLNQDDVSRYGFYLNPSQRRQQLRFSIRYKLLIKAASEAIRADYAVYEEEIDFIDLTDDASRPVFSITRDAGGKVEFANAPEITVDQGALRVHIPKSASFLERLIFTTGEFPLIATARPPINKDELAASALSRFIPMLRVLRTILARIRVYQLHPPSTRKYASPNPRPELARDGEALPSVILQIQRQSEKSSAWEAILAAMREVLPELDRIEVRNTASKTLELVFYERGMERRPWTVDEISDGTIQTLAALVAISDPGPSFIFLEEPENSVHPWIIRSLIRVCRKSLRNHQIAITSHSPVVMDEFSPDDITVLWRSHGETNTDLLSTLSPRIAKQWKRGAISTFDAINSGIVVEAIPPAPQLELELAP